MNIKNNFVIMIGIITVILIVGYLPTSSISSYASVNILDNSFVGGDKDENIQKITTNATSSDNRISNGNLLENKKAPEFYKIEGSINTGYDNQSISVTSLKGKVVLVNFWTYSCINVLRTLPHLLDWDAKYSDDGLVIVGVHTPEFEFEKNIENVKSAVQRYGINYPVLLDNVRGTWNAYENNYWPRMYLVDAQGYIRYDKIGEGDYDHTEKVIQSLLKARNADNDIKNTDYNNNKTISYDNGNNETINNLSNNISSFLVQPVDFTKIKTSESYFGNQSSRSALGNPEGFHPGQILNYSLPMSSSSSNLTSSIKPNTIYLEGQWKNNPDNIELQSDTGRILLNYSSKSVNLVAGVNGNDKDKSQSQLTIYDDHSLVSNQSRGIDVGNNGKFVVNEPRLYNIVNHKSYSDSSHSLLIDIKGKGLQSFVFTFG